MSELKSPSPASIQVFIYFTILLSYPLLSFVWRRAYPADSGEMALLFCIAILLSLALTIFAKLIRDGMMSAITLLVTLLVLLVQFNFRLEGFLIALAISALLFWKFGTRLISFSIPVIAMMVFAAFLESSDRPRNFQNTDPSVEIDTQLPPVVHILLDGFIGTAGLPSYPESRVFNQATDQFLNEFGFTHFPKAYSRFPLTGNSLYTAMNFEHESDFSFRIEEASRTVHTLTSNRYFDNLAAAGYRMNIYQTSYMNFCESNRESTDKCWNYSHPNVHSIRDAIGVGRRSAMLAKVIVMQSRILALATNKLFNDPGIAVHDPSVLQSLTQDLLSAPQGRVFFAHLLIPHDPFVFLNDCSIYYEDDLASRSAMLFNKTDQNPEMLRLRTQRYFEQAECGLLSLRKLFNAMKKSEIFGDSFIVIHGDHGSHVSQYVPNVLNQGFVSLEDMRAHYSTLFAFKPPDGTFSVNADTLSLPPLLEAASLSIANQGNDITYSLESELTAQAEDTDEYVYMINSVGWSRVDLKLFD